MFWWVGAILLLLIAGLEVDLQILRHMAKPGATATFAIVISLVTGAVFASKILGRALANGFFLGLVLSVTGVSVVAKILIERDALRRGYAQVILAAMYGTGGKTSSRRRSVRSRFLQPDVPSRRRCDSMWA